MTAIDLEESYPLLKKTKYKITSDESIAYNCVAWIFNDQDNWWSPVQDIGYFWPIKVSEPENLDLFLELFDKFGFEPTDNAKAEQGWEKIAIYSIEGEFTHVAKQLQSGNWSSKLGEYSDIEHELKGLMGHNAESYGEVTLYLKRKRVKRSSG